MIDVVIIIILLLMVFYGYRKGFINIALKLVSTIVAFALAYFLAEPIGDMIAQTNFGQNAQNSVTNSILGYIQGSSENSIIYFLQQRLGEMEKEQLVEKMIDYVFVGIGFVLVFVVSRIILWIIRHILESIFELPVLRAFNKLGGVITAIILFLLEISIILAVIKSISTFDFMEKIVNGINTSRIARTIYNHNIITSIIINKIL